MLSKKMNKKNQQKNTQQKEKQSRKPTRTNTKTKTNYTPLSLSLQFTQISPSQYQANKIYEDKGMDRVAALKQKVDKLLQENKQLGNCQFAENQGIQDEDSLKLMNFVIGGYVDNDFDDFLSFNQFNQKKEDFDILKEVYETNTKRFKEKKLNNQIQIRSLHSAIYLNENMNKISRVHAQQFLKKNKMVW